MSILNFAFILLFKFNSYQGFKRMKKLVWLLPVFALLAGCASSSSTVFEKISDDSSEPKPIEVKTKSDKTLFEMIFGKSNKTNVVEMEQPTPLYRLPTRGDRYMANEPTPEAYAIAARRATNKMLDESGELYENTGNTFLYITDIKKADRQMPDGVYNAARATKKIVQNSRTFKVVEHLEEADYILEPVIDNAGSPESPILVYKLILFDTENNRVGQWAETLRRVVNDDQSWW